MYGPHTLEAYERQFEMLADHLLLRGDVDHGLEPADLLGQQVSFKLNVMFDGVRRGRHFGDVIEDAKARYSPVSVVSALPPTFKYRSMVVFVSVMFFSDLSLEYIRQVKKSK